jgi:hypothetical protein
MEMLACGCPGSQVRTIEKRGGETTSAERIPSELRQWPIQLRLVPAAAPWLQGADLLIAADCTAFSYGDFHRDFLRGKVMVNACPKLDDTSSYVAKLTQMFSGNDIRSVTVAIMEVPCCNGLHFLVQEALRGSGKEIPFRLAVIGVDGERRA